MARNKYPEQTLEKILNVSAQLFIEKGYEQTSIQDILDELELSKGGLYHHFRSKEEILEAVMQRRAADISQKLWDIIRNTQAETAKEKLKKILRELANNPEIHTLDNVLTSQVKNPYFVINGMQTCVQQDAAVIGKLMEEGVADGSLQTEQPQLCAEVFLLLLNFWINPALFHRDFSETKNRLEYLQSLMDRLGADILDQGLMGLLLDDYVKMGVFSR